MKKTLFLTGGVLQAGLIVFHVYLSQAFAAWKVPEGVRGLLQVFNVQGMAVLVFFAYMSLFRWRDLDATKAGRLLTMAMSGFYLLRAANQVIFLSFLPLVFGLCLLLAGIYAVPLMAGSKEGVEQAEAPAPL